MVTGKLFSCKGLRAAGGSVSAFPCALGSPVKRIPDWVGSLRHAKRRVWSGFCGDRGLTRDFGAVLGMERAAQVVEGANDRNRRQPMEEKPVRAEREWPRGPAGASVQPSSLPSHPSQRARRMGLPSVCGWLRIENVRMGHPR
jgi:hypothetical protein